MTRVRQTMRLLAAIIPLLSLAPLAQAQTVSSPSPLVHTPDGRPLHQWNPSESWPGGSQHDSRADAVRTIAEGWFGDDLLWFADEDLVAPDVGPQPAPGWSPL